MQDRLLPHSIRLARQLEHRTVPPCAASNGYAIEVAFAVKQQRAEGSFAISPGTEAVQDLVFDASPRRQREGQQQGRN